MRVLRKINSEISLTTFEETKMENNNSFMLYRKRSFYNDIKFVLVLAQFFGVMPLSEIGNTIQEVKFNFISLQFFYAIIHFLCVFATGIASIIKLAVFGFLIDETSITSFYIFNSFASIHFMYLATKWNKILKEYSSVEHSMKNYGCRKNVRKLNIWTAVFFMFFGLTEHILFILANLNRSVKCLNFELCPVEIYFGCAFPYWFSLINYSHWAGILVEFTNFISTFTWNFTDLFIILISISLREKFNQIAYKIKRTKNPPFSFWKEVREDYYKVSNLTKEVDIQIAGLVLISFLNNIFFLCIQLYNSLKKREAFIDSIYFFYSFGYIVLRVVAVSLYSATLNEAARRPLIYLYSLPSENYTIDVSRLITQINYLPNGITGHGFFLITKNFLLQAAATIVTFELMIFQFSPAAKTPQLLASNRSAEIFCIK